MNSPDSTVVATLTNSDIIKQRIYDLQEKLQTAAPGYESLLHNIHQALAKDPDAVHLLTDEEVGTICAGLSKRTGIVIAEEKAKKRVTGKGQGKIALSELE